jgi:hypothetical protein
MTACNGHPVANYKDYDCLSATVISRQVNVHQKRSNHILFYEGSLFSDSSCNLSSPNIPSFACSILPVATEKERR